jgi:hypothetical protein
MHGAGLFARRRGSVAPDDVPLPAKFDLTFDRATRHCILVWRQISRAGVKFEPI